MRTTGKPPCKMRDRLVPDDKTLRQIFLRHHRQTARWILEHEGWECSLSTVQNHRRRLKLLNPIRGAQSLSDAEFWGRVEATQEARF